MKEFNRRKNFPPVRFQRKDLEDLLRIAKEDFGSSKVYSSIGSQVNNMSVLEDSISKFFSHKDIPTKIFNLTISLHQNRPDTFEISKRVYLSFDDYSISASVTGVQESWVNGKIQQLEEFINKRKAKLWYLFSGKLAIIMWLVFMGLSFFNYRNNSIFIQLGNVLSFTYLVAYALRFIFPQRFYPNFSLNTVDSENRDNFNKLIGLATLIFTIALFVLGLLEFFRR